jgi:hypothetical protein
MLRKLKDKGKVLNYMFQSKFKVKKEKTAKIFKRIYKEFIPIKLKLSRFLDNQKLVDLVWKVGLWVTGNLKGI